MTQKAKVAFAMLPMREDRFDGDGQVRGVAVVSYGLRSARRKPTRLRVGWAHVSEPQGTKPKC